MSVASLYDEYMLRESLSPDATLRVSLLFALFQALQLAGRLPPAVTWLAAYRWLNIPVRIVLAQRRIRMIYEQATFDRSQLLIAP